MYMRKTVKTEWNIDRGKKRVSRWSFFAFQSRKIVVSCHRVKNRKFLWYNSVDAIALAGTAFCRSNRKQWKGASAYENENGIHLPFGTGA